MCAAIVEGERFRASWKIKEVVGFVVPFSHPIDQLNKIGLPGLLKLHPLIVTQSIESPISQPILERVLPVPLDLFDRVLRCARLVIGEHEDAPAPI